MIGIFRIGKALAGAVTVALLAAGCTYDQDRPVLQHFQDFKTVAPRGNTVTVCHAYGCKMQTRVRFTPTDIAELKKVMDKAKKGDNAEEERRAVAYAVGWMERFVGDKIGTSADRPGMEYDGPGDPTQQDCVDESTNTTSYLLVLESNGFLKYHTVGTPFAKENLIRGVAGWTHWTAVLKENDTGERWAVDSWIYENGENPAIVEASKWYIEDLSLLPKPKT
ncbi:MAG: hypothetical protein R3D33_06435 [Hyphomicrobiaceae bacterium]